MPKAQKKLSPRFVDQTTKKPYAGFESNAKRRRVEIPQIFVYEGPGSLVPDDVQRVVIGAGVGEIPAGAFFGRSELVSVDFNHAAVSIGAEAFYKCRSLTGVSNACNIVEIGARAFCNCSKLSKFGLELSEFGLTFGSELRSIGESAFRSCCGLRSVEFEVSSRLTEIGAYAFANCRDLRSVRLGLQAHFPTGVEKTIGSWAFSGCSRLEHFDFGDTTRIGSCAFQYCWSLERVVLSRVRHIGDRAFFWNSVRVYGDGLRSDVELGDSVFHSGSLISDGADSVKVEYIDGRMCFFIARSLVRGAAIPAGSYNRHGYMHCIRFAPWVTSIDPDSFVGCDPDTIYVASYGPNTTEGLKAIVTAKFPRAAIVRYIGFNDGSVESLALSGDEGEGGDDFLDSF